MKILAAFVLTAVLLCGCSTAKTGCPCPDCHCCHDCRDCCHDKDCPKCPK